MSNSLCSKNENTFWIREQKDHNPLNYNTLEKKKDNFLASFTLCILALITVSASFIHYNKGWPYFDMGYFVEDFQSWIHGLVIFKLQMNRMRFHTFTTLFG